MKTLIYTLSHPATGEIRYIGKTVQSLSERLTKHVSAADEHEHYCSNWLKSLAKEKLTPVIEYLDQITEPDDGKEWIEFEQYWIAMFKSWGFRLTNLTDGGEGCSGYKHTEETKAKLSAAKKGKPAHNKGIRASQESRIKMSMAHKGKKLSAATKAKMSEASKGKLHSEEARIKMSEKLKGRTFSEEHRANLSQAHKGKQLSEETKAKLSIAAKKRKLLKQQGSK